MSWESCVVTLNSDSTGSFYTGDIVTGSVKIKYKEKQIIESLEFIVVGISKAQWTRPSPNVPHIKFYSQKKKVLYMNLDVFDEHIGKTVSATEYEYSFHFFLPNDLPSTFKSGIAQVNYCIQIKSTRNSKHKKVVVPFVVLGTVNLNHIQRFLEPSYHEINKMFWNTKIVSMSVKTYTAFACKQNIPLEITITNQSTVKIHYLIVSLRQKLIYNVTEGYANDEKGIYKIKKNYFLNLEKETFNIMMDIPQTIPSSIHTTDPMIDISYILRIQVKFMFHTSLFQDIPVTISTVPVLHIDF